MIAQAALARLDGGARIAAMLGLSTAFTVFVALTAQLPGIFNPIVPAVPITLQVLAVALTGMLLGSKLGAAALVEYYVLGLLGFPVFSNAGSGLVRVLGPTGGYLLGFIAMAFVVGWIVEREREPGRLRAFWAGLVGLVPLYALGAGWYGVLLALAAAGALPDVIPATATVWVRPELVADLGTSFGEALLPALSKAYALTVAGFILVDVAKVIVAAAVFTSGRELLARLHLR